jgi:hypothetical protein
MVGVGVDKERLVGDGIATATVGVAVDKERRVGVDVAAAAAGVAIDREMRVDVGTDDGAGSQAERAIRAISAINRYPVRFPVIGSFLDIPETPIRLVPRGQRAQRRSV